MSGFVVIATKNDYRSTVAKVADENRAKAMAKAFDREGWTAHVEPAEFADVLNTLANHVDIRPVIKWLVKHRFNELCQDMERAMHEVRQETDDLDARRHKAWEAREFTEFCEKIFRVPPAGDGG